jgi:tetratricopeptide (TPR) repeat protein
VYNYPYGDDPINTAHKYIKLALTLNPNCQQAYITLGWLHILARNKEQAILNLEKGYSINPNSAFFNCELSICMAMLGEYGKSQQYLERALKMNPLPYWWLNIPSTFIAMKNRNFEKMLFSAQSMQRLPMIYDSVFEIVALYFLDNKSDLKFAVKAYQKKYKDGFAFVEAQLAGMIFDDELRQMFTSAFRDIRTLYIR